MLKEKSKSEQSLGSDYFTGRTYTVEEIALETKARHARWVQEAEEYCNNCGGYEACKYSGLRPFLDDDGGYWTKKCEVRLAYYRAKEVERLYSSSRLPARFKSIGFEAMEKTADNANLLKMAQWLIESVSKDGRNGGYIYGESGRGKTMLVACVANELIKKGVGVLFSNSADLLDDLRPKDNGERTDEKLEKLKAINTLIIDDLGAERLTDWGVEVLYKIINARWGDMKQTIITSNYSLKELGSHLTVKGDETMAQRIYNRLVDMCYERELKGEDYRLRAK